LLFEFVTEPREISTPPAVTVKDEGDCTTSGVVATPPTSTTGCDGVSRLNELGDSGSGGIVVDVVVVTGTVVVVVVVLVVDVVLVVVVVVVGTTATATTRDVFGPLVRPFICILQ